MTVVDLRQFREGRQGSRGAEPESSFQAGEEVRFTEESRDYLKQNHAENLMYLTGLVLGAEGEGILNVLFPKFDPTRPIQAPPARFMRAEPHIFGNTRLKLIGMTTLEEPVLKALNAVLAPRPDPTCLVGFRELSRKGGRCYDVFEHAEVREKSQQPQFNSYYIISICVQQPGKRLGVPATAYVYNRNTHHPLSFED